MDLDLFGQSWDLSAGVPLKPVAFSPSPGQPAGPAVDFLAPREIVDTQSTPLRRLSSFAPQNSLFYFMEGEAQQWVIGLWVWDSGAKVQSASRPLRRRLLPLVGRGVRAGNCGTDRSMGLPGRMYPVGRWLSLVN